MRNSIPRLALFLPWITAACANPVLPDAYMLEFPRPPDHWNVLGAPSWQVEWKTPEGIKRIVFDGVSACKLSLSPEWPNPVTAWPFWPGLEPGTLKPAGALYPFDVEGNRLLLSWRGGVDAVFYHVLEEAARSDHPVRKPEYFDWQRFRKLMASADEDVRRDPWLVNWKETAVKTISSSFRASYVKAEKRTAVPTEIPGGGPWFSASPFRKAEQWETGGAAEIFCGAEPEVWICSEGILKVSLTARIWIPNTGR